MFHTAVYASQNKIVFDDYNVVYNLATKSGHFD